MNNDPTRYAVAFTPLSERIAADSPHLSEALAALKQAMGDADFDQYIETLGSLRKVDNQLLLITRKEMNRSILMGRFLPHLKQAFDATYVRIINQ